MAELLVLLSVLASFGARQADRPISAPTERVRVSTSLELQAGTRCRPGIPPALPSVRLGEAPAARPRLAEGSLRPGLEIFEPPCVALVGDEGGR